MRKIEKAIPFALAITLLLSGCGEKSECDIPTRHVHRYTKQTNDDIVVERYIDDEHLNLFGYKWNKEYIEINKIDEAFYRVLRNNGLFEGANNWPYLYNVMATHHDYLMFYYEYDEVQTRTETDSEGNVTVKTEIIHHHGWHTNPNYRHNTGETRLYHHRYYGYKVVYENGKFKMVKSPIVDDIREVIDEYPYFAEDCVTEVFETFRYSKYELGYLSPEDYDTFIQPDLENKNLEIEKPNIRTYQNNY